MSTSDAAVRAPEPTDFDHNSTELTEATLWPAYERLLAGGGVSHSDAHDGFYVVSRFGEIKGVLRDPGTFASGYGHRIPVIGTPRAIPIDYDPPLHTDYRAAMVAAVNPRRITELLPFVHDVIADLVGDFHAAGGGDAVAAIALPLPLRVLTELVGFSEETVAQFRKLTEAMWQQVNDLDYDEARRDLRALVDAEIERHRECLLDDYLTRLLGMEIQGRRISDDEVARLLITVAVAGHETTMNAAASLLWLLAAEPELQTALRADHELAPKYVEEMLRLRTPAQNFARQASEDTQIGEVHVPEGSRVLLCYAAANRDPEQFPNPERFDASRASRNHFAFGWGIHQCIGAGLARAELKILLETLCAYPPVELAAPASFGHLEGGIHYGPTELQLRFAAEERI
jgi:cytochrome P450